MQKVKRGLARRVFSEVSESRHSPLVLVGAPHRVMLPLDPHRTKCSLRDILLHFGTADSQIANNLFEALTLSTQSSQEQHHQVV